MSDLWSQVPGALFLVAGSVLVAFGIGEGAARFAARDSGGDDELPVLKTLADIYQPDVLGTYRGVRFRTNSQRLRGPELSAAAPPGTVRIAIAGDSVTMGQGVEETDAYPAQLQRMLNAEGAGTYQVLNVGLAGSNAAFAVQRLSGVVDYYGPDLLIYGFTINDIEGPRYRQASLEARHRLLGRYRRFERSPSYLLRLVWPRWVAARERIAPTVSSYEDELLSNYFENPDAWEDFEAALDGFVALGRLHGLCVHVFIHTHLIDLDENHPWHPIYDKVVAAAERRNLTVTQSWRTFVGYRASTLRLSLSDAHPNATAHRMLAATLLDGIHRLSAECWPVEGR